MGLFGLTGRERALWACIEPGQKGKLWLPDNYTDLYDTVVEKRSEMYLYLATPRVGNAYLEVPAKTRLMLEIDIYTARISKVRFSCQVIDYNWFQDQTMKFVRPRSISWMELRRFFRVEVNVDGEFSFVDDRDSLNFEVAAPSFLAHVRNISEGGALFLVDKLMPVQKGSQVNVRINLNTGFTIKARGRVAHIEPAHRQYGIGIQFLQINAVDRQRLRACISLQRSKEEI